MCIDKGLMVRVEETAVHPLLLPPKLYIPIIKSRLTDSSYHILKEKVNVVGTERGEYMSN